MTNCVCVYRLTCPNVDATIYKSVFLSFSIKYFRKTTTKTHKVCGCTKDTQGRSRSSTP